MIRRFEPSVAPAVILLVGAAEAADHGDGPLGLDVVPGLDLAEGPRTTAIRRLPDSIGGRARAGSRRTSLGVDVR